MLKRLPPDHNQWLSASWYIVEAYFYRRLLDNTGYFLKSPDPQRHLLGDPFSTQKRRSLQECLKTVDLLVQLVEQSTNTASSLSQSSFRTLLYANLWSNKADLSKNPQGLSQTQLDLHQQLQRDQQDILIDHTDKVFEYLMNKKYVIQIKRERKKTRVLNEENIAHIHALILVLLSSFSFVSIRSHCVSTPL
jgi:hypothetical protein